jgi:regulator of protease activity HflC (stomatin/prohibitin superfamily)
VIGPEHYSEAERILGNAETEMQAAAKSGAKHIDVTLPLFAAAVANAQVHATLALAAATADRLLLDFTVAGESGCVDLGGWDDAQAAWIKATT